MQVAALHSQLAETQQARHSLAVRLASLQAQLRQRGRSSGGSLPTLWPGLHIM